MIIDELPAQLQELLERTAQVHATSNGHVESRASSGMVPGGLFLVGGVIRDVLLDSHAVSTQNWQDIDIDIAIEGDALLFVSSLRSAFATDTRWRIGRVQKFKKYGTAKIEFLSKTEKNACTFDFAQCRREVYDSPGSIPTVSVASISEDLWRRDFSINAMAVCLSGEDEGALLDPCAGSRDLIEKTLRVLHDKSFLDDPMRILRGFRLAKRLAFSFETRTEELLREAIAQGVFTAVSAQRRFDEFRKAMNEPCAIEVIDCLSENGVLTQVHPLLEQAFQRFRQVHDGAHVSTDRARQNEAVFSLRTVGDQLTQSEKQQLIVDCSIPAHTQRALGVEAE